MKIKSHKTDNIVKQSQEVICLGTVKGIQVFLSNSNSNHFCRQLNRFKYSYVTLIILFDCNHLFAVRDKVHLGFVSCFYTLIVIIFCTQLNRFKYSYVTLIILFDCNHLFAHRDI